ncbi:MAG: ABC transporter ATP-binding protein [Clostridium sp.]
MKFIEIKHLSKSYGKGAEKVKALTDINLVISKGEFVAIVGASGSGKSTLLNIIGGVDSLDEGEILVSNINITKLNERELTLYRLRKVGFVFQNFNLISALTVEENIEMPVLLDEEKLDENFKKELLSSLNLERKKSKLPEELSGGEKQRVAIGRALSNKPEIILADEPTGNLDSRNSIEVIELLKYSARKYNQTLIIITHDERIALEADRVIKLKDGKIVGN